MLKPIQFNTPRKPTFAELKALYIFQFNHGIDYGPYYDTSDLENEIRDSLNHALIAVYDNLPKAYPDKIMMVIWGDSRNLSSYMLYTWKEGQLEPLKQDETLAEVYFGNK